MRSILTLLLATAFIGPASAADPTAVVFDCDGVLVESEALKLAAWQLALEDEGVTLERAEYIPLVGHDNRAILKQISVLKHKQLGESVIKRKEQIYAKMQKQGVPWRTEGLALVKYLEAHKKDLNIKLGLASGGLKKEILENLKQAGIHRAFDAVASGHDDLKEFKDPGGTNKPKPYIYQKMAKMLGVNPKDVAVFEDSAAGVEAGARAGMTVYAVPNDYTKGQDFKMAREVLALTEAPEPALARLFSKLPPGQKK